MAREGFHTPPGAGDSSPMRLYYYRDPVGNVGDDLNLWIWPKLVPGLFDEDDGRLFLGIGTLLSHRVPPAPPKVVLGAGVGYGRPPVLDGSWTIYGVRGPLSAQALGLDSSLAMTDPGVLVRFLDFPDEQKRHTVSFIPHHASANRADWRLCCRLAGIHYIDPRESVPAVVRSIKRSDIVVAEAMHGAILADALRVPWVAARFHQWVNELKWRDWCGSVGLTYKPITQAHLIDRAPGWRPKLRRRFGPYVLAAGLRRHVGRVTPQLSANVVLEEVTEKLMAQVERLRMGYAV